MMFSIRALVLVKLKYARTFDQGLKYSNCSVYFICVCYICLCVCTCVHIYTHVYIKCICMIVKCTFYNLHNCNVCVCICIFFNSRALTRQYMLKSQIVMIVKTSGVQGKESLRPPFCMFYGGNRIVSWTIKDGLQ